MTQRNNTCLRLRTLFSGLAVTLFTVLTLIPLHAFAWEQNPKQLRDLLDRIGGDGTSQRIETEVDEKFAEGGKDVFILTQRDGKPLVKGSSLSAATTGINWYLNHYVHANLTWNQMTTDLSTYEFPLPQQPERHVSTADLRYYLNYCTFSYSMAFWSWERWQKEIDWMALHGINAPLMLVGADVVWKNVLTDLGYSKAEVNDFVSGPAFQAWWLMNNEEGWGGPNPDWWYKKQESLSRNILARMRELGMRPVLPGYSGMIPRTLGKKLGWNVADAGMWCGFNRPAFLPPTDKHFTQMATLYYKHLTALMGKADFYSMDPFHEGGRTDGIDLSAAYSAIYKAMLKVNKKACWVAQAWGANPRRECLDTVPANRLIVLDLFAECQPQWQGGFRGHDFIYCMLHNFGGRVGLHGRLKATADGYYAALKGSPKALRGIGTTPEGIENNPIMYEELYELPWRDKFDEKSWLHDYALARYGKTNATIDTAWARLATSVYDCNTKQHGTTEPVMCARPKLVVNNVSTWTSAIIAHDVNKVRQAAAMLYSQRNLLKDNDNYQYDLVDVTRQALEDYANGLLRQIKMASDAKDSTTFKWLSNEFLQLILDQDRLLSTRHDFMLGAWTEAARSVAARETGTTKADQDWMDWNARTLITVWGNRAGANDGGLRDYSNREWGGLLRDFHYMRWKYFFDCLNSGRKTPTDDEWFKMEETWTRAHNPYSYTPREKAIDVAGEMIRKYKISL